MPWATVSSVGRQALKSLKGQIKNHYQMISSESVYSHQGLEDLDEGEWDGCSVMKWLELRGWKEVKYFGRPHCP